MAKKSVNLAANFQKFVEENPDDFFSAEETERRMSECMARLAGRPATMNMRTGQNLKEPFLTDEDLKARGYPCQCEWE